MSPAVLGWVVGAVAGGLLALVVGWRWSAVLDPGVAADAPPARWWAVILLASIAVGVDIAGRPPAAAALSIALSGVLAVIAVVDARTRTIPIAAVALLALLGLAGAAADGAAGTAAVGGAVGLALFALLWAAARPFAANGEDPFGAGDVLLAGAVGLVAAWPAVLGVLFLGSLGAAAYAGWLVVARSASATATLPFGAFLCIGALVAVVRGTGWC